MKKSVIINLVPGLILMVFIATAYGASEAFKIFRSQISTLDRIWHSVPRLWKG